VFPKTDSRSTVSDARLLETCRQCHASATPGFVSYDPHADKDDKARNPALFYTSRFMTWLLTGVFGFFGLHAMLWLPRGLIARRQRSSTTTTPDPGRSTGAGA
jgi:hypothetical protein